MAAFNTDIQIKHQTRPCWVDGRRAMFHRWTDSARPVKPRGMEDTDTTDRFQVHSVHALVEYEDGTMERVWPNTVQFADSRELFESLAWEEMEARRDALPYEYSEEVAEAATQATLQNCLTCGNVPASELCGHQCYKCHLETVCNCRDCNGISNWTAMEAHE